jgi:hypothetical protein
MLRVSIITFVSTIAFGVCVMQPASAAITQLSAGDRVAVLSQKFDVVKTTSTIPKCVRDEFARNTGGGPFSMADPNQAFQSTVMASANLPYFRLVFGASSDNYYLIEALRGGTTPSSEVFLFKLETAKAKREPFVIHQVHGDVPHTGGALVFDHTPQSAKLVWSAVEQTTSGDLAGVRKAIAENKMSDSPSDTAPDRPQPMDPAVSNSPMPTLSRSW